MPPRLRRRAFAHQKARVARKLPSALLDPPSQSSRCPWRRAVTRHTASPRVFNLTISQSLGPRGAIHMLGCELQEVTQTNCRRPPTRCWSPGPAMVSHVLIDADVRRTGRRLPVGSVRSCFTPTSISSRMARAPSAEARITLAIAFQSERPGHARAQWRRTAPQPPRQHLNVRRSGPPAPRTRCRVDRDGPFLVWNETGSAGRSQASLNDVGERSAAGRAPGDG